jgi:hypothetical protein
VSEELVLRSTSLTSKIEKSTNSTTKVRKKSDTNINKINKDIGRNSYYHAEEEQQMI